MPHSGKIVQGFDPIPNHDDLVCNVPFPENTYGECFVIRIVFHSKDYFFIVHRLDCTLDKGRYDPNPFLCCDLIHDVIILTRASIVKRNRQIIILLIN